VRVSQLAVLVAATRDAGGSVAQGKGYVDDGLNAAALRHFNVAKFLHTHDISVRKLRCNHKVTTVLVTTTGWSRKQENQLARQKVATQSHVLSLPQEAH
jgi:hypothetical protein